MHYHHTPAALSDRDAAALEARAAKLPFCALRQRLMDTAFVIRQRNAVSA